jgi:hypothetical protein
MKNNGKRVVFALIMAFVVGAVMAGCGGGGGSASPGGSGTLSGSAK